MSGTYLLATILCLAVAGSLGQYIEGNYNVSSVCTTVKTGTQLGSIESCDYYYVCTATGPVKTFCSQGYAYNYKTSTCSPSSQVSCYYGLENPCQGKTGDNWVPVAGSCSQWIYCKNEVSSGKGSCGSMTFNPSTQVCDYSACDESPGSVDGPYLSNLCDVMPSSTYFGSTDNCATYNYCYPDGRFTTANCATTAFIVQTGYCGLDENGNCDRIVGNGVAQSCNEVGKTQGDPETCGNYLFCNGKTYESKSCPNGQYFDVKQSGCVARQMAVPAPGCNRCQYAKTPFVNAADSSHCQSYYYCKNGASGSVSECPYQTYFNENEQGCAEVADGLNFQTYVKNNGACYEATVPPTTTAAPTTTAETTTDASTTKAPATEAPATEAPATEDPSSG